MSCPVYRAFRTHHDWLPKELALAGITDMEATNRYLSASQPPHAGKYTTGCALRVLSRTLQKNGQAIRYRTGQFYLSLTAGSD